MHPGETRTFTPGSGRTLTFSAFGAGTAPLGNLYHPLSEADAQATLSAAVEVGSRYIDTAPFYGYGLSERRVGTFLRAEKPNVIVSTKVGRLLRWVPSAPESERSQWFDVPNREVIFDYSYDGVMRSYEHSLERMGVDRVEILFCHDIDAWSHGSREESVRRTHEFLDGGHRALMQLREEGRIDAFGLGVNEWEVCQFVAERAPIDLFLLAGRYTLLEQEALTTFLPLCEEKGLGIVIGGPYNSGILATGAKPGAYYQYQPAPPEILERVSRIEAVCARHKVRLRDAALQFPLYHPAVVSVIPGAVSRREIEEAAQALSADIPPALWAELKAEGLMRADAPTP
jgi:D-threo-aldose 1-dehydrogenase